ncbi:oxalate:formate antiporter, partial [Plakobranchus ocellatus]
MDSYFQFSCYPKCADCNTQWLLSLYIVGGCPGALLTKILVKRLGLKRTGVFSMFVYSLTLLGSAWVLQHSVAGTAVLYLFLGQAVAISYSVSYQLVNGWAPDNFALFTATVTGFPTTLSVIQNQLVTAYVNPHNLKTDAYVGHRTYFSQPEILNRVPTTVMLFGVMTFGLQLIGCILITNPSRLSPKESFSRKPETSKSNILENKKDASITATSSVSLNEVENSYKLKTYGSNKDHNETIKVSQSYQSVPSTTKLENSIGNFAERGLHTTSPPESIPKSWKPSETVKTPVFYAVWLFGVSMLYGLILKSNYYKQFALLYIYDDKFLTLV